jgi:hypothetical protein
VGNTASLLFSTYFTTDFTTLLPQHFCQTTEVTQRIPRPHFDGLDTAFLQLSFAMKLWHYVREGSLPREKFDISLTIQEDNGSLYVMNHGEFKTDDDIAHAAGNHIGICFGVAAITLWEAISECSGLMPGDLSPVRF